MSRMKKEEGIVYWNRLNKIWKFQLNYVPLQLQNYIFGKYNHLNNSKLTQI